ncbi:DNA polymerase III subunit alpha [Candidatus Wolfebacteria bacterium]|nr:DNA polymerase III subunit alpha [Candidatus Wolfebacteria bacterium]
MSKFVHLHTHSHYSLLDGLAKIDELIARAKELGMKAIALTDHGNLYGAIEFYKAATKAGIKPILGVEAYIAPGSRLDKQAKQTDDKYYHLTLLAENNIGWRNLIQLVTTSHLDGYYYRPRMDKDLLRKHHEGVIALSGCLGGEISQAIINKNLDRAEAIAREYQEIFGKDNYFLEIGSHIKIPDARTARDGILEIHKLTGIPLAGTHDIHYLTNDDAHYHDVFLAVQTGNRLTDDDRLTLKEDDFSLTSQEAMIEAFKDIPEATANTVKIAERCTVTLTLGKILFPTYEIPVGEPSAIQYLRKLCMEKLSLRYPENHNKAVERLHYELDVIEKTGFADYFLIVQDFVNWAKSRGIVVGPGRGSAAGSLVSYVLNITDVDPLRYDLLFERFLNPDRNEMPDIDLDFTDVRRDEVLSYLRQKYGDDHVAQIITFGTMAARAAIRDAGRALGLAYGFCDQLAKMIPFNQKLGEVLHRVPEFKALYDSNPDAKTVIDIARRLEGVARHASVHACGVVVSNEPLATYVPLQLSPQDPNITITQFEMHSIEDLGLLKIDLLGLKNLTIIEDTVRLIRELDGETIDISALPLNDKKTFELLAEGDTTGVFQLESSGMRHYLKDLMPTELEDIIAMVSLYRPGPMELIPSFINRKFGREKVSYIHPKLEPILKNTYGIGVYQEQMMRIARDLAGFTLAEADTLRKAIGKKIKALLDAQKEKLVQGMIANGIDHKTAKEIWELFPPFARYGFNRSHAACYALIAYRTAYLKAHYPIEFMTSLLNADSGDVERIAFLIMEAKKDGITVLPPNANTSSVNFMPEGDNIRFGLLAIKNVGANLVDAIINERQRGGPFNEFNDFLKRIAHKDLNKKSLESLIKAGVFDSLCENRKGLLEHIEDILAFSQRIKKGKENANGAGGNQGGLFGSTARDDNLSFLNESSSNPDGISKQMIGERLTWEKELLGLYISGHPLREYRDKIDEKRAQPIKDILAKGAHKFNGASTCRLAGVITKIKRITTKTGQPILFVEIEDLTDSVEMIVFSDAFSKNPAIWKENNIIIAQGKLSPRVGETKFVCEQAIEVR